jgi:F-type H+-transporting ATPase subunit delta
VARRYARALFELAAQQSSLDGILQEVNEFGRILADDRRLRAFLLSPLVEKSYKIRALEQAVNGRVSPLFHRFLLLLVRKGRQDLYQEIAFEMGRLYDSLKNRSRATVLSAIPLTVDQLEAVRQRLAKASQSEVLVDNKVDPAILGGLVVRMNDQVLDASVAHQLERLRKELQQVKIESTKH